jgi:hypothetical protein
MGHYGNGERSMIGLKVKYNMEEYCSDSEVLNTGIYLTLE